METEVGPHKYHKQKRIDQQPVAPVTVKRVGLQPPINRTFGNSTTNQSNLPTESYNSQQNHPTSPTFDKVVLETEQSLDTLRTMTKLTGAHLIATREDITMDLQTIHRRITDLANLSAEHQPNLKSTRPKAERNVFLESQHINNPPLPSINTSNFGGQQSSGTSLYNVLFSQKIGDTNFFFGTIDSSQGSEYEAIRKWRTLSKTARG
uniref:Uncharacterized protein n=1 Tax=Caenorhabditis japonica TaxID=281687 RepID=A0A8R1IRD3_CAEJA